jgi:hypothetical protein
MTTVVKKYRRKSDDEIAALAKQIYRNEVFVSWMIENLHDLPMVFMPLLFIDDDTRQQMLADEIQFFYADYNDASPRGINGNPCFMEMRVLDKDDGHRLHARVREIAELVG